MVPVLFGVIDEINMKALGFNPDDALSRELFYKYKLSPEQRTSVIVCFDTDLV
jgi:hypothetical protein